MAREVSRQLLQGLLCHLPGGNFCETGGLAGSKAFVAIFRDAAARHDDCAMLVAHWKPILKSWVLAERRKSRDADGHCQMEHAGIGADLEAASLQDCGQLRDLWSVDAL